MRAGTVLSASATLTAEEPMGRGLRGIDEDEGIRKNCERLLENLDHLTLAQMLSVVAAWSRIPRHRRERAWAGARRIWRATASDEPLDRACRARRTALRAASLVGLSDPTFSTAAFDATVAVASGWWIEVGDYDTLVGPLALALPWLLTARAGELAR